MKNEELQKWKIKNEKSVQKWKMKNSIIEKLRSGCKPFIPPWATTLRPINLNGHPVEHLTDDF